jgi:hypothetical protein
VIEPGDIIELAPGVTLERDALVDAVRSVAIPINATAHAALADARTVADVSRVLESLGAPHPAQDAHELVARLNALFLLNVRTSMRARAVRRLAALRYGLVARAPAVRLAIRGTASVAWALAPVAAVVLLALLPLAVVAGATGVAVAAATAAGVVLHECAHVAALRGVPRALILQGLTPSILHTRVGPARALVAAAAGPAAPALVSLLAVAAWRSAAVVCAPLAAHALALTVAAADGRNACGLS